MSAEQEPVIVRVALHKRVFDRLNGVAAVNGEDRTTVINRAIAFYETFALASRWIVVTWIDVHGKKHRALVLS